jgi:hypothetical protein
MAGRSLPFPSERKLVLDICHFSRQVPSFPVEMTMRLDELAAARQATQVRISWAAIFVRAMGLLGVEYPVLRQSYLKWPWPHIYEHPTSVASIAIHREGPNSPFVAIGRIESPEAKSLAGLQWDIDNYQARPIEMAFREQLRFSKFPALVRRLTWSLFLNAWGRKKSCKLGTFGLSTLAGYQVANRRHPCVLSYSLSYSRVEPDGRCDVTLQCDHRVIDGALAAEMLNRLQEILRTEIHSELRQLGRRPVAA